MKLLSGINTKTVTLFTAFGKNCGELVAKIVCRSTKMPSDRSRER